MCLFPIICVSRPLYITTHTYSTNVFISSNLYSTADNLLLNDTQQRLKIADFGFAVYCRNESIHNPPGCLPGTRSYNPPEVSRRVHVCFGVRMCGNEYV